MSPRQRERLALPALLLLAAAVFSIGVTWGLPSRRVDPYLLGSATDRDVQRLRELALEVSDDPRRAADVDADPIGATREPVTVNATDKQRAQIFRRYRLFTFQPDEMITMMSLAGMRPGRLELDPRLYQYGGLWIYPVGALLKAASLVGLIELRAGADGRAYYLDHPEAFGRFYVVARLYAVAWGVVGAWAVFHILRALRPSLSLAVVGTVLFICMPVVVNMAHEAKPHMPGMTLILLAVLAGARYVKTGRGRDAWLAGTALCGAALGMVLSTLPAFVLLPLMTLLRPMPWMQRLRVTTAACAIGGAVYAVTNPYVVIHLFYESDVLWSNLNNSRAFYQPARPLAGLANVALLTADGMTLPLALAGTLGAVLLGARAIRKRRDRSDAEVRRRAVGLLLAAPAVLTIAQAAMVGAGKPGEFGRFLLLADVFLAIEAVVAAGTFVPMAKLRAGTLGTLAVINAIGGGVTLSRFVRDAREVTPRLQEAERLRQLALAGATHLEVTADPAPYGLPPVDLFRWQIVKLPQGWEHAAGRTSAGVLVRPRDVPDDAERGVMNRLHRLFPVRVSWAAKPFDVHAGGR